MSSKSRKSSASAAKSFSASTMDAGEESMEEVIDLFQSSSTSNNTPSTSSFSTGLQPRTSRTSTIAMNSQQYEQISVKEILSRLRTSNASTTSTARSTAVGNMNGLSSATSKTAFNISNKDLIAAGMTIDDLMEPEHAEYCIEAPKSGLLMKEEVITPLFLPTRCELEQEDLPSTTPSSSSNNNNIVVNDALAIEKYGPEVRSMIYCADQELFAEYQGQQNIATPAATSSSSAAGTGTGTGPATTPSSNKGKAHWGLHFDSQFEGGNLFLVESFMRKRAPIGYPEEYDCYLCTDPVAPLPPSKHVYSPTTTIVQNQWFFFRIKNTKKKVYRFHIHNLTTKQSAFLQGMKPVMISEHSFTNDSQGWKRVGQDITYRACQRKPLVNYSHSAYHPLLPPYDNTPMEGKETAVELFTLSFTFSCAIAKDTVYFALASPYSYTQLQNMVYVLSKNPLTRVHLQFKTLCRSLAGNKVDMLVITENNVLIKDASHSVAEEPGHPKEKDEEKDDAEAENDEDEDDDLGIDDYKLKDVLPQSVILQALGLSSSMPGEELSSGAAGTHSLRTPTPPTSAGSNSSNNNSNSSSRTSQRNSKFINRPSVVRHPPPGEEAPPTNNTTNTNTSTNTNTNNTTNTNTNTTTGEGSGKQALPRFLQKLQHQMDEDKEHVRRLKLERRRKPAIIITARLHPNETCSSWICEGIIKTLLGNNAIAQELRKYFVFYIIPMMNPDGVINGLTRHDISGYDLKDHWVDPSATLHPHIYIIKQLLRNIHQTTSIAGYFELRGQFYKEGMYFHSLLPSEASNIALRPSSQVDPRQFFYTASKRSKYVVLRNCSLVMTTDQEQSAKYFTWDELHVALSMTIEASMLYGPKGCYHGYGHLPPPQVARINPHLQPIDYGKFGLQICLTLADLFVFPTNPMFQTVVGTAVGATAVVPTAAGSISISSGGVSIAGNSPAQQRRRKSSLLNTSSFNTTMSTAVHNTNNNTTTNNNTNGSGQFNSIVDILEHLPDIDSDKPFEANTAPREHRVHTTTSPSRRRSSASPKHASFISASMSQQSMASRHFSQSSFSLQQFRKMSLCIGSSDQEEQLNQSFVAVPPPTNSGLDQYSFSAIPPDEDRLRLQQLLTASGNKGDTRNGDVNEVVEVDIVDDLERQVDFNEAIWEHSKHNVSEDALLHSGWGQPKHTTTTIVTSTTNTSNTMTSLDHSLSTYYIYKNLAKLFRRKEVLQMEKLAISRHASRTSTATSSSTAVSLKPSQIVATETWHDEDSEDDELDTWTGIQSTATNTERVYRQSVSSSGFKPIQLLTLLPSKVGQKIQELERRSSSAGIAVDSSSTTAPITPTAAGRISATVAATATVRPTKLAGIHEEEEEHHPSNEPSPAPRPSKLIPAFPMFPSTRAAVAITAPTPVAPAPAPIKPIPNKVNVKGVITVSFSAEAIEERKQQLASTRATILEAESVEIASHAPTGITGNTSAMMSAAASDSMVDQKRLEDTLIQRMVSIDFNEDTEDEKKKGKKGRKTKVPQAADSGEEKDSAVAQVAAAAAEEKATEPSHEKDHKKRKSTLAASNRASQVRGVIPSRRSTEISGAAMAEVVDKVTSEPEGNKDSNNKRSVAHKHLPGSEESASDHDTSGTEGKHKPSRKTSQLKSSSVAVTPRRSVLNRASSKDANEDSPSHGKDKHAKTPPAHAKRSSTIATHATTTHPSKGTHKSKTLVKAAVHDVHTTSMSTMMPNMSAVTEDFEDSVADSEHNPDIDTEQRPQIVIPGIKVDNTTSVSRPVSPTMAMIDPPQDTSYEEEDDGDDGDDEVYRKEEDEDDEDESLLMTTSVAANILLEEEEGFPMPSNNTTTGDILPSKPAKKLQTQQRGKHAKKLVQQQQQVTMSTQTDTTEDYFITPTLLLQPSPQDLQQAAHNAELQAEEAAKKQRLLDLLQTMFSISPSLANALQSPAHNEQQVEAEEVSPEQQQATLTREAIHVLLRELGITSDQGANNQATTTAISSSNSTTNNNNSNVVIKKDMPSALLPTSMNISAANIPPATSNKTADGVPYTPANPNPLLKTRLLSHPHITDVSTLHVKKHATLVEDEEDEPLFDDDEDIVESSPPAVTARIELSAEIRDDPVTSRELAETLLELSDIQQRQEGIDKLNAIPKLDFLGGKAVLLAEPVAATPTTTSTTGNTTTVPPVSSHKGGVEPPQLTLSHQALLTQLRDKYSDVLLANETISVHEDEDEEEAAPQVPADLTQQTSRSATPRVPPDWSHPGASSRPESHSRHNVRTAHSTAFTDTLPDGEQDQHSHHHYGHAHTNESPAMETTIAVSRKPGGGNSSNKYYHLTQHAKLIFASSANHAIPSSNNNNNNNPIAGFASTAPIPAAPSKVSGSTYGQWDYKGQHEAAYQQRRKQLEAAEYETYEKPNSTETLTELQGRFLQDMGLDYELIFGKNGILARSHWGGDNTGSSKPATSAQQPSPVSSTQAQTQHTVNLNGTYSQGFPTRTAIYDQTASGVGWKKRGAARIAVHPEYAVNVSILNDYQKAVYGFYNHVLSQLQKNGLCGHTNGNEEDEEEVAQQIVDLLQQQLDPHMGIVTPRVGVVHSPRGRLTAFPTPVVPSKGAALNKGKPDVGLGNTTTTTTIASTSATSAMPSKEDDGEERVAECTPMLSVKERMDLRFAQIMAKEQQLPASTANANNTANSVLPSWLPTSLQQLLTGSSNKKQKTVVDTAANSSSVAGIGTWLKPTTANNTAAAVKAVPSHHNSTVVTAGSLLLADSTGAGIGQEDSLMNPSVPSLQQYATSVSQDSLLLPPTLWTEADAVVHPPPLSAAGSSQRRHRSQQNSTATNSASGAGGISSSNHNNQPTSNQKKDHHNHVVKQLQIFPDRVLPAATNNTNNNGSTGNSNAGKKLLDKKYQQRLQQAKQARQQERNKPISNPFLYDAGGSDLFLISSTAAPRSAKPPSTSTHTNNTAAVTNNIEQKFSSNQEDTNSSAATAAVGNSSTANTTTTTAAAVLQEGAPESFSNSSSPNTSSKLPGNNNKFQRIQRLDSEDSTYVKYSHLYQQSILDGVFDADLNPTISLSRALTPSVDPTRPAQPKPSHLLTRPR